MRTKQEIERTIEKKFGNQIKFTVTEIAHIEGVTNTYKLKKKLDERGVHRGTDKIYFISDVVDFFYQTQ